MLTACVGGSGASNKVGATYNSQVVYKMTDNIEWGGGAEVCAVVFYWLWLRLCSHPTQEIWMPVGRRRIKSRELLKT